MRLQNTLDPLLDAEVNDLVTVVRQDYVNQVFADVVHVAFNGRQDHRALGSGAAFFLHERFEETYRGLHCLGGLQNEGQLHLAAAKQVAHNFHPLQ